MVKKIAIIFITIFSLISLGDYDDVIKYVTLIPEYSLYKVELINGKHKYYSTKQQKYLTKDDILRSKYEYIINYYHNDISIDYLKKVDFNIIDINRNNITFGDLSKAHINLEIQSNKVIFKPFVGFPSLYTGEKIEVKKDTRDLTKPLKYVAFTFDDGPINEYHAKIRDLFDKYNQKATFCVVGKKLHNDEMRETLKETYEHGHELINHSFSHKLITKLDDHQAFEEILKQRNLVLEITGFDPVYFRPPYGAYNSKIKQMVDKIVLWNVDSYDWKLRNKEKNIENIKAHIDKNHSLVLLHDIHKTTYESMVELLPEMLEQGYVFVTYSDWLKINKAKGI